MNSHDLHIWRKIYASYANRARQYLRPVTAKSCMMLLLTQLASYLLCVVWHRGFCRPFPLLWPGRDPWRLAETQLTNSPCWLSTLWLQALWRTPGILCSCAGHRLPVRNNHHTCRLALGGSPLLPIPPLRVLPLYLPAPTGLEWPGEMLGKKWPLPHSSELAFRFAKNGFIL
jgi:hypothetical protein